MSEGEGLREISFRDLHTQNVPLFPAVKCMPEVNPEDESLIIRLHAICNVMVPGEDGGNYAILLRMQTELPEDIRLQSKEFYTLWTNFSYEVANEGMNLVRKGVNPNDPFWKEENSLGLLKLSEDPVNVLRTVVNIDLSDGIDGNGSQEYQDKIYYMLMFQYTKRMFDEKLESLQERDLIKVVPTINYYELRELGWKGSYATRSFSKDRYLIKVVGDHVEVCVDEKPVIMWPLTTTWDVFEKFLEEFEEMGPDHEKVQKLIKEQQAVRM